MLPIRDDVPKRLTPSVNYLLILVNAAVFLQELSLGDGLEKFVLRWGLVPARYAAPAMLHKLGWQLYFGPFLTHMFLHGGWLHILGNMWMLYIFGAAVEDRLGHARYLAFYLLCGFASAGTQLWASWGSRIPELGASGAIAGVMGAYLILNPSARVTALIPIFFFVRLIEVPASLYLVFWLWSQLYAGRLALRHSGASGGVAWWAHISGFAAGVVLLGVFLPAKSKRARE